MIYCICIKLQLCGIPYLTVSNLGGGGGEGEFIDIILKGKNYVIKHVLLERVYQE
jgi:hypothetical protein